MIVECFGIEFEFTNSIISIGSVTFDVRKAEEWEKSEILSHEGELARLYLNALGWTESTKIVNEQTIIVPARVGIDLATSSYDEIWTFLNTTDGKMSESLKELLRKCMKIKDSRKFKLEIDLVTVPFKNEYMLIDNETQSIESLGRCGGGILGKVRLDGSTHRIPKRVV